METYLCSLGVVFQLVGRFSPGWGQAGQVTVLSLRGSTDTKGVMTSTHSLEYRNVPSLSYHPEECDIVILDKISSHIVCLMCQAAVELIHWCFWLKYKKMELLEDMECSGSLRLTNHGWIPSIVKELHDMRLGMTCRSLGLYHECCGHPEQQSHH